jgi:hypothetical protein
MEGSSKAGRGGIKSTSRPDGRSLSLVKHGNPAMGRTYEMEFLSFRMQPRYGQRAYAMASEPTLARLRLDKIGR